jgi:hypothetical protein
MTAPASVTSLIAWWGAGLSTLLALIKLWEVWRDRFRVDVSYNFAGLPQIGNKVLIRNLGSRSFILTDWDLLYCSGRWPFRRFTNLAHAAFDDSDRRVEPYSTYTLTFADDNHFDWGVDALKGRSIHIRLGIAGRRAIVRLVYRP